MDEYTKEVLAYTKSAPKADPTDPWTLQGVRILGLTCLNGEVYPREVLAEHAGVFEGAPSYLNHKKKQGENRRFEERVGTIKNVECDAEGLICDYKIFKKHPYAEMVKEAYDENPLNLGMSWDGRAKFQKHDSKEVCCGIEVVRSVDLVCNPAATRSLRCGEEEGATEEHPIFTHEHHKMIQDHEGRLNAISAAAEKEIEAAVKQIEEKYSGQLKEIQAQLKIKTRTVQVLPQESTQPPGEFNSNKFRQRLETRR